MEMQEKSFRDLQQDERLKRLERHLKLTQIKRPNSSNPQSFPHTSISSISSIHGDINPLSDFSFSTPSVVSSRAGSVILASSNNLRKKLSKNLKMGLRPGPATSSVFDQSLESRKLDEDKVMMPPPPAITSQKPQPSVNTEQKVQAVNAASNTSFSQSYDNQNRNIYTLHEAPRTESNTAIEDEAANQVSRSNDTSKQCGRVFKNWTVRLNNRGQVIIKGRLESGEYARSKAVKRRLSANTLLSVLNHKYHLVGDIHDLREELPEYIRGKFYNGFPMDWENVRQIWQGYVASGFSLQFRWPRPMADSDDDLRSDITDLTVAHLKNTSTKNTSLLSTPRPSKTAKKLDRSSRKREGRSQRKKVTNDSDISAVCSVENEESDARGKTSALETSCRNTEERINTAPDNHLANQSESKSRNVQANGTEALKCENLVPRWKVDVIIDNLMNKNCSTEYIEKIITAIDCINELLTMPSTNKVETPTDEGVSLNYNSNSQTDMTSSKILSKIQRAEIFKNIESSRLQHSRQAAVSPPSSYSLESCEEPEPEEQPQSKHKTFICERSVISSKINSAIHTSTKSQKPRNSEFEQENIANYPEANRGRKSSTPVRPTTTDLDSRHMKNKENQGTATLPREEKGGKLNQTPRHKRKNFFDSADSDTEGPVLHKTRTTLANNSPIVTTGSLRTLGSKHQPSAAEKMKNGFAEQASGTFCDSDVSIVDTIVKPAMKARIVSIQTITDDLSKRNHQKETLRSDFSFASTENIDQSQANYSLSKRSGNLSNIEKTPTSSSLNLVEQCTVRLNKVNVDQHNHSKSNFTPAKTQQTAQQKSKMDASRQSNELAASDSENVSMRMSSRGRRILPPLDYWNGERVCLKGRELVYSPSKCLAASVSANTSILKHASSPNATAISEPVPASRPAKNLNQTPTRSTDRSKSALESASSKNTRQTGRILSEISPNCDEKIDDPMFADRRMTRTSLSNMQTDVKKTRNGRRLNVISDTSSEDEEINSIRRRKKRKIY